MSIDPHCQVHPQRGAANWLPQRARQHALAVLVTLSRPTRGSNSEFGYIDSSSEMQLSRDSITFL